MSWKDNIKVDFGKQVVRMGDGWNWLRVVVFFGVSDAGP
jgi:hypothetical protein